MPFADNGGVRIHWQEQGSGTPIVLVMGHRYSAAMWYPILPALAAKHRVIWFDNRGTGESAPLKCTALQRFAGPTGSEAFRQAAAGCAATLTAALSTPAAARCTLADVRLDPRGT